MTEERALLEEVVAATKRVAASLGMSVAEVGQFAPVAPWQADTMSRNQQKDVLSLFKTYEQLVDLLSNRLIRTMLALLGENTAGWSARDAFRYMEERGSLEDAQQFLTLVLMRNRLAHEYPMDAEKRARRINETLGLAPMLLREAERLLEDAEDLLAESEPEEEPEEDLREVLASSIPDDIWVWGPSDDPYAVVVWEPQRPSDDVPLLPNEAPELTQDGFHSLLQSQLAMRIRAWESEQGGSALESPMQQILTTAFNAGRFNDVDEMANYIVTFVCESWLIGEWSQYHGEISWPQKMRQGTQKEVEILRNRLLDDPDFGELVRFWGKGSMET